MNRTKKQLVSVYKIYYNFIVKLKKWLCFNIVLQDSELFKQKVSLTS